MINYPNDKNLKPDMGGNATSTIFYLLAGGKNLPTLPEINLKLIKACSKGQENISEITDLIRMDPSLSLKVIDMYYSGFGRHSEKLTNLENALRFIGVDVLNIMISCNSAVSIFDGTASSRGFDLRLFWKHSLKCAYLSEIISKEVTNLPPEEAFLSGLFHDIGKLILFASLPNIYGKLLTDNTEQGNIILKEKKTIGMDHCQVAYRLIDRWHYHPFMADAILYHHYPIEKISLAFPSAKIIYLANLMASSETTDKQDIPRIARELLGLTKDKLDEYVLYAESKLNNAAAVFEIDNTLLRHHQANVGRGDAHLNLAAEIRDTSLIAYTMQNILRADNKESVLRILSQGFQVLFGNPDIYFFLYDKNENALIGHSLTDDEYGALIDGLRIPVNTGNSLLASCLQSKAPLDSFSFQKTSELALMDSQLVHFTSKEGIFCLPMIERDEPVGTIVIGVDRVEHSFFSKQINLLNLFTGQCALALFNGGRKTTDDKPFQSIASAPEGILSRKIIHEINNPLSVIKNYLKVLGMKLEDHKIDHDEIRIINDEINRISKMLKNLSAPPEQTTKADKAPVNVNALLADIIKLTNGSLGEGSEIKIHLDNDPTVPEVKAEKDDLKQVFMNLIKNAIEAMPLGGNIEIKTSFNRDRDAAGGKSNGKADGNIQITVTDDGPGISDEVGSALFNEFVTSKQGHEGLGLSIVKGIINNLNGSIRCESIMDKGTSFIIDLPLQTS
jgi:nitrogen-specific signal transduction histidine kinase/HD-like signal output (HDOD) protein